MNSGPLKAFENFLKLTDSNTSITEVNENAIAESIKPFLSNPERHWEHIELMTEARWGVHFYKILFKHFPKFLRKFMGLENTKWSNEYTIKVNRLREHLLKSTEPAKLSLDILPTRILETPSEWVKQNKKIHLIEIKTAIKPSENLLPNSFELNIDFDSQSKVQLIESYPSTDFSEGGRYQVDVSNEGKFVTSSNIGGELKIGTTQNETSAKFNVSKKRENENKTINKITYEFQYTNQVLKIISSAVGCSAHWRLLRTKDHLPIGGLNFFLTALIHDDVSQIKYIAKLSSEIETWGNISIEVDGEVVPSKS